MIHLLEELFFSLDVNNQFEEILAYEIGYDDMFTEVEKEIIFC